MHHTITIGQTAIGPDSPVYIVAEMSANHLKDYHRAVEILWAAKEAGANAIKLQTFTPDTITLDVDNPCFRVKEDTLWAGRTLYQLYQESYMPWEWQPKLMEEAKKAGLDCFSSPFDFTAVEFMAQMDMPAYKVASYEITDIPLIRKIAQQHKPVIFATGIARLSDIHLALQTCLEEGNEDIILLKCVSSYPTAYADTNLRTIPSLAEKFQCLTGLSDHTMGSIVPIGSIALGARMIEKHLTLRRADGGPDGAFSMEPEEFARMTADIRTLETALGSADYALTEKQEIEREGARSLFAAQDIRAGEIFTPENARSVRPERGTGLHPRYYEQVLGKTAAADIAKGTPLSWELIQK